MRIPKLLLMVMYFVPLLVYVIGFGLYIYHSEFGGFHSTDKNIKELEKKKPKKFGGDPHNLSLEMGFVLSILAIITMVLNNILGCCLIHRIYKPVANRIAH